MVVARVGKLTADQALQLEVVSMSLKRHAMCLDRSAAAGSRVYNRHKNSVEGANSTEQQTEVQCVGRQRIHRTIADSYSPDKKGSY